MQMTSDFEISRELIDAVHNVLFPLDSGEQRGDGLPHNVFRSVRSLVRREYDLSEVAECDLAARLIDIAQQRHVALITAPQPPEASLLRGDIVTPSGAQAAHRPPSLPLDERNHGGLRNGTIGRGEDCFHEVHGLTGRSDHGDLS